ncbi:hypothetical protein CSUI_011332, partial [Cystoisospora suis]
SLSSPPPPPLPFCFFRSFEVHSFSLPQLPRASKKSRPLLSDSSSSSSFLQRFSLRKHKIISFSPTRPGVYTPEPSHLPHMRGYLPTSSFFSTLSPCKYLVTPSSFRQTSLSSPSSSSSHFFLSCLPSLPSLLSPGLLLQRACLSRNLEKESFASLFSPRRGYRPAINWVKTRLSARMHQYRKRSLKKKNHSKVILRFKITRFGWQRLRSGRNGEKENLNHRQFRKSQSYAFVSRDDLWKFRFQLPSYIL